MISRENVTREALSELEALRTQNLRQEKQRRAEAAAKSPVIAALLEKRQKMLLAGVQKAFSQPQRAREISASMREEMQKINEDLRKALSAVSLPEDYLQPIRRCPICEDRGYVGEPVHEQCVCLKRIVLKKLYQKDGLQVLERENFSSFDESIFPDVPIEGKKNSQRGYIRKIREICEDYANAFDPEEGKGLLLTGKSGLGKTFLMNCVAQRVLERGYSVVVISAYMLLDWMRRFQFNGEGESKVEDILNCDLLCIDDLGSEPMMRSVTVSTLYHVINVRHSEARSIIVTTNCDSDDLYEKYDDRVAARLTDPSRMKIIPFTGADVRRFAAQRGGRA